VDVAMPTHSEAIQTVLNALVDKDNGVIGSMKEIDAVGHRVVHGGEAFNKSVLITDEVMKALEDCIPLAPLHNPANITGINACTAVMGKDVPQVAVFDTAFHQTMPAKAYMYALPYEYYENDKVRRYGFHGTSHKYVAGRAAAMLGKKPEELKLISCHLGNGSSVTAIDGGKSVDTSMGFTPLAGLPMGTRSGDLDAGILQYLMNKHNINIDDMLNILNKKSGVQGVSGVSSDFRDLENAHKEGNERAGLAVDMFNYGVKKLIGAYAAAMGGVDAIIFTAGVGENSASQRMAIASGLEFMGVKMDAEANNTRGKEAVISAADSKVKVLLIPTNEELMIAMDTAAIVKG
jgi:acetate kinase